VRGGPRLFRVRDMETGGRYRGWPALAGQKEHIVLPCEKRLPDGSYLSRIYASDKDRRRGTDGIMIRIIEYRLEGVEGAEPLYRLATTIVGHELAPAAELAALYHERWEIETVFDELKTHLRGAHIVLRSKTPDLVRQEFYGLLMAHFAVRGLMHKAALSAPARVPTGCHLSMLWRIVRRKMAEFGAIPPQGRQKFHNAVLEEILDESVASSRNRRNPRGVKRKMSNYPLRRGYKHSPLIDISAAVKIVK
jgi:Transposase DDE domain